jgi:protein-L-isoaspartate(D-aspartate) O-methyltransferase
MFEDPLYPTWPKMASMMVSRLGLDEGPIAQAMREVPRHRFLPRNLWESAYYDTPLPVGPEATISAPHMVAIQLETAEIRGGERILDLGSGSGYLACLAAYLAGRSGKVVGVEIEPDLAERSRASIEETGFADRVVVHVGDAAMGYPPDAPYDRLVVSYAVRHPLPEVWRQQLRDDGILVGPIDRGDGTYWEKLTKKTPKGWNVERGPACMFVSSKT